VPGLLAASQAEALLAVGEHDQMCQPRTRSREVDPNATVLPGLGHNAHVEDPGAMVKLIADLLS